MSQESSSIQINQDLIDKGKWLLNNARAFDSASVIKTIQEQELQRLKDENRNWKMAGAAVGLMFGMADGFDFTDLLGALGGSAVAGMAQDYFSDDQKKFLQQINAFWIVDGGSPLDIARRVGTAKSRVISFTPGASKPFELYNHHRGNRGDYFVRLSTSNQKCDGFNDPQAYSCLAKNFSESKIAEMGSELYPSMDGTFKIDSLRQVKLDEATQYDQLAASIADDQVVPVIVERNGEKKIYYRSDIPIHSDF